MILRWTKQTAPRHMPASMPPALEKHGPRAHGRSRGGFETKIHSIVNAFSNPVGFTLTGAKT